MSTKTCRGEGCEIPPAENGDFCANHWRYISLGTRHLLLEAAAPGAGRNTALRNKALFAAAAEIRAKTSGQ